MSDDDAVATADPVRFGALLATDGWIVLYVDDFAAFREWERFANQLRIRLGNPAELRELMKGLHDRVFIDVLPVIAWAVRTRGGESDEIVPLVPWMNRIGPADEIGTERQFIRMASISFLDEDERRALTRDGVLRRKLEWYAEKTAE
ncbi:MAG: hypothetical protein FJX57_13505 [Alphaproteobacteria bacterium]|nr:hypothetical protein [Alphaproteobacteria bacterium]